MVEMEEVESTCETRMGRLWVIIIVVALVALAGVVARKVNANREM